MTNIFTTIEFLCGSFPFLITVNLISFFFKFFLLVAVVKNIKLSHINRTLLYLIIVLTGAIFEDFSWILLLIKDSFLPAAFVMAYRIILFFVRIAWVFYVIEYQAMCLFIESLITNTTKFNKRQIIFLGISILFCLAFILISVVNIPLTQPSESQIHLQQAFIIYTFFLLVPTTLFFTIKKINHKIPRIIKTQVKVLIQILIIPKFISDFIQSYPFRIVPGWDTNSYAMIGITTIILTTALFYCVKKIIGLRFLNFQDHVQATRRYNFVDGFKDTLEELATATSIKELAHLTQNFFKTAFLIPGNSVSLHFRSLNPSDGNANRIELSEIELLSEQFLNNKEPELEKCLNKVKILIYDEIDFNNFYDPNYADQTILAFMEKIHADIFLPIYKNQLVIGYIVVERYARLNEFYSHIERDEMLVFASYLSNIINLLQHRNLDTLIYQEKELKEELYKKHQEINQYKESLRSFLKHNKQKEIGIIFYKQRNFVFANQAAKEIIKININANPGAPLTKALKTIATQVEEYKAPQNCITKTSEGERVVICGVPNLEKNQVILTVYYPDFSDILINQLNYLKDPSLWDYLLYLETTKPGQLINQLIPGSGEQLLQFKINLLQIALSKKALLLEMAFPDLLPTVELLHHISMRTTLHVLTLQGPSKNHDIAIKLFGINPIFGTTEANQKPLLERLDGSGTLFIQNIEFMDFDSQEYLAEFIKYGYYRVFKSDQKQLSSVRIICSTNQNLQALCQENAFSASLLNELKKTSVSMPSLLTLPEVELTDLAQGLAEQAVKGENFKNLLDFNQKDKHKIIQSKPASLQDLKTRVQQLLSQKTKENNIDQDIQFDPAYGIADPDLVHAARLGKHALRDQRIMSMLWNKFKNQNKIATFLGVNRSSVNRRCKEFNLL